MNVPQGSVTVTAGGVTLVENQDYTVDYSMGVVTIINQSIIDAGTNVSVDFESNDNYGMQRKTLVGFNLQYDVSKDFTFGGTFMFLNEQPLTTKVNMGEEPLKNTLWGVNLSWKKRKPMADQPDRQNTAHRCDRAFANQLYRGVRPTHCRAKQEDTGVGFLHR